ncbi:MAG: YdbH domain-containing protein, partial [Haemophilus parahaemolyticus]|nr:YdbH domain-containing protein [Haemophilus parahaemolyticus]
EIMDAISKSSGYSEQILAYLLNDTTINELKSHLDLTKSGDLTLKSQLKMKLNQQANARLNFNYNHKENLFQLWHLINTGTYVEQDIENRLYQKLDNQKLDNLK